MKGLARRVIFYSLSLFLATQLVTGIHIQGGLWQYLVAGASLTIMMLLLKPILQLLAFPFNLITFGFFSIVVNAIILFLLTLIVPQVHVIDFSIAQMSLAGFSSPSIHIIRIIGFLLISAIISGLYSLLAWIVE